MLLDRGDCLEPSLTRGPVTQEQLSPSWSTGTVPWTTDNLLCPPRTPGRRGQSLGARRRVGSPWHSRVLCWAVVLGGHRLKHFPLCR